MAVIEELVSHMLELSPARLAALLETLPSEALQSFFQDISEGELKLLLPHLDEHSAALSLEVVGPKTASVLAESLPDGCVVTALRLTSPGFQRRFFEEVPEKLAQRFQSQLLQKGSSITRFLSPTVLPVQSSASIDSVLAKASLRKSSGHIVYVVDESHRLVGKCELRDLLISRGAKSSVSEAMAVVQHVVSSLASVSDVLSHPGWEQESELPIVDDGKHFVGVLTHSGMKKMERTLLGSAEDGLFAQTASELGELYKLGLSSLLVGVSGARSKSEVGE